MSSGRSAGQDDWGLAPLRDQDRRDLLEIVDDRYALRSTILANQLPVDHWHDQIGDATIADAICDRLLHNAQRIVLAGPSWRLGRTPKRSASLRADHEHRSW